MRSLTPRRNDQNPHKDYSMYWFAALLILAAAYIMIKDLGYLK